LSGYFFATKARIDNRKKFVKHQCLPTRPDNMVNFDELKDENGWGVWGTSANFNGFRVLGALLHGTLIVGVSQTYGVEQRAPPIFGRAAIKLGIGPHSSFFSVQHISVVLQAKTYSSQVKIFTVDFRYTVISVGLPSRTVFLARFIEFI